MTNKLFDDRRFRCPNGHTNDEKAIQSFWRSGKNNVVQLVKKKTKLFIITLSVVAGVW